MVFGLVLVEDCGVAGPLPIASPSLDIGVARSDEADNKDIVGRSKVQQQSRLQQQESSGRNSTKRQKRLIGTRRSGGTAG